MGVASTCPSLVIRLTKETRFCRAPSNHAPYIVPVLCGDVKSECSAYHTGMLRGGEFVVVNYFSSF